jgi:hypothetical protein
VVASCTVEGDTIEVTSTVVCVFDPLGRVVGAWMVLTIGGGVVTVTMVDVLEGVDVDVDDVVVGVVVVSPLQEEKIV